MKLLLILFFCICLPCFADDFVEEASGICKVGRDIIIAGDEEPSSLWITSGKGLDFQKISSDSNWDDLEGLTSYQQNLFFAITSHSLTKKGKRKPERERLMLFSKMTNGFKLKNAWSLREAILIQLKKDFSSEINMNQVATATPDEGGLNIEGLVYKNGKLYLGLRSPLTQNGEAILMILTGFNQSKELHFDQSLKIDLSGKGIRSLDQSGESLVIVAGSKNDRNENFELFKWDGSKKKVTKINATGFDDLKRPEGVLVENPKQFAFVQDFLTPEDQDFFIRILFP